MPLVYADQGRRVLEISDEQFATLSRMMRGDFSGLTTRMLEQTIGADYQDVTNAPADVYQGGDRTSTSNLPGTMARLYNLFNSGDPASRAQAEVEWMELDLAYGGVHGIEGLEMGAAYEATRDTGAVDDPMISPDPVIQGSVGADPRTDAWKEIEFGPEGFQRTFDQYLATNPTYRRTNLLGKQAMAGRFGDAFRSFQLTGVPEGEEAQSTFRQFLGQGAPLMSGTDMMARLRNQGRQMDAISQAQWLPLTRMLGEDNRLAHNAYLDATLKGIHPMFQPAASRGAKQQFDQFMGERPTDSFLQYLNEKRGYYGRQLAAGA